MRRTTFIFLALEDEGRFNLCGMKTKGGSFIYLNNKQLLLLKDYDINITHAPCTVCIYCYKPQFEVEVMKMDIQLMFWKILSYIYDGIIRRKPPLHRKNAFKKKRSNDR